MKDMYTRRKVETGGRRLANIEHDIRKERDEWGRAGAYPCLDRADILGQEHADAGHLIQELQQDRHHLILALVARGGGARLG